MNQITHWLDASNVYGSGISDARRLRTFRGGKLRTGRGVSGADMLPDSGTSDCKGSSKRCFLAGSMFVCASNFLLTLFYSFHETTFFTCR